MLLTQQKYITYLWIHLTLAGSLRKWKPLQGVIIYWTFLLLTVQPWLIQWMSYQASVMISDHEMIRVTSNLSPVLLKPNEWKIYLWNKTDFNQLNLNMTQFSETFLDCYTIDTPIQDLWDIFKMQCYDCLDLVPHIFSAKPDRNPWINNYVKWFTNKKQHLYNRA